MDSLESHVLSQVKAAREAATVLARTTLEERNDALETMAAALVAATDRIVAANAEDMAAARARGTSDALLDRLMLDAVRIQAMRTP